MHKPLWFLLLLLAGPDSAPAAETPAATPEGLAFFEQKIRPLLAEHCYDCHSTQAKKLKGGLYLDTKDGWEKGGDSGEPALRPGRPEDSLLIRSVRHDDPDAAMPPKKPRLTDAAIADLVT
jgi:mono/diheme cytochrome c family protein